MVRYYRNLWLGIIDALFAIENGEHADQVVAQSLKVNKKWGAKDRRFVASTIYDITRYKRLFYFVAGVDELKTKDQLWAVLGAWCVKHGYDLPYWDEFASVNRDELENRLEQAKQEFTLWENIPDWLNEMGENSLPEVWQNEMKAQNEEAPVVLRVNGLKLVDSLTLAEFQKALAIEGIETKQVASLPDALLLDERQAIHQNKYYKNGSLEIQDGNSQRVVLFADAQPGELVVDACAGAGGKSLYFADIMKNEGEIIAIDVEEWKLMELNNRASRAGAKITTELATPELLAKLKQKADVVLVDAPCSGTGTIRRKADLKDKLTEEFIQEMIAMQQSVLIDYAQLVKPGGRLVYATCSLLPQENGDQKDWFLNSEIGKDFEFVEDEQLYTHETGFDGFYMAKFVRKQ